LECPFCHKKTVKTIFTPSHFETHTSRISSGSKTVFYKTKDKYEVQDKCSNCGKSAKQIQKAFDEGIKDPEKTKKKIKELEKLGFPSVWETKV
jgi:hypothetical protein